MLTPQEMREKDPMLFFFEACAATFFVTISSLKKMFLWLERLDLLEKEMRGRAVPLSVPNFVIIKLQRLNFYRFIWMNEYNLYEHKNSLILSLLEWSFQPLNQGGNGLFIRNPPPWKSRWTLTWVLDLSLSIRPHSKLLWFLFVLTLTLTLGCPRFGLSIDLEVASSFDRTLTRESFDVWLVSRCMPWPLTLTLTLTLTWFWPRLDLDVVRTLGRDLT